MKFLFVGLVFLVSSLSYAQKVSSKFVEPDSSHEILFSEISGGYGSQAEKIYDNLEVREDDADRIGSREVSPLKFDSIKTKSSNGVFCTKSQNPSFTSTWTSGPTLSINPLYTCQLQISFDKNGAQLK